MDCRNFFKDESGAATVDYVVIVALLVGLGLAITDSTGSAMGEHARGIRGELQGGLFETAWDDQLAVQVDLDGSTP